MAEVTEKPAGLPSTNELDKIPDLDTRAEIYLSGSHVATLDEPPAMGEKFYLMVELEVTEVSHKSNDGGQTLVAVRRTRRVGDMWRPGTKKPEKPKTQKELDAEAEAAAAENQPPLYEDDPDAEYGDTYDAEDGDE